MSEPTYGSGPYETSGSGYGGQQQYSQPQGYGGQQYGGQYQQPAGPATGGYPQQGGYPSQGSPLPTPSAERAPADRVALTAQMLRITGFVLAGVGLLTFILLLTVDIGTGTYRFANALQALVLGVGLGGLNVAAGTWLGAKPR
jgi:hypothetical protein